MQIMNGRKMLRFEGILPALITSLFFAFLAYAHLLSGLVPAGSRMREFWWGLGAGFLFFLIGTFINRAVSGSGKAGGGLIREAASRYPLIFTAALISLPVVLFNLVHVFGADYLLADDPAGYWTGITHIYRRWLWHRVHVINAFTETFSWWIMANYSPFVIRLLYLLLYLTGISLSFFWVARRIFNLNPEEAFLASVLPAVFPLQFQIIAGVNMSYTLLGQLLVLLSLAAGFHYLIRKEHSWSLLALSTLFFLLASRQMEQALFVSAAVIFLFLAVKGNLARKIALILPVAGSSALVLERMLSAPREAATIHDIPFPEMIIRGKTFLLYLSPYLSPSHPEYAVPVVAALFLVGCVSLYAWRDFRERLSLPEHFAWLPEPVRPLVLPGFAFLWTVPSVIPFITMIRYMDVRTIHLSGYGPWLVIAPGLMGLLRGIAGKRDSRRRSSALVFMLLLITTVSGLQHLQYAAGAYKEGNYYWKAISRSITRHGFPEGSQIAIVDADTGTHETYPSCTGYLARMLGNRIDIGGLVGSEYFFYDPFARSDLWHNSMTGLKVENSLHIFRFEPGPDAVSGRADGKLQRFRFFLRVVPGNNGKETSGGSGDWMVFRLGIEGESELMARGQGLAEYRALLDELAESGIRPEDICWGDPDDPPGCNSPLQE